MTGQGIVKALIIEDDPEIVESVSLAFQILWPEVKVYCADQGKKAIDLVESETYSVIILDLGLPDVSGYEVLRQIRCFSPVPVIILTVKSEEGDVVKGLEWGADDFIVKPCGQLELLARVKARMRDKCGYADEAPVTFGTLRFNPLTRQLFHGEKEIRLTAIEAQIVHYLMRNGGRVATYPRLAEDVWGDDYPGSVDSLRVHIRRLREKMEADPSHPELILTKAGVGYYLTKPT